MAAVMKQPRLARGLGWFSIGLGLTQIATPKRFAKAIGVNGRSSVIRAVGVREIASGIGILAQRKPAPWVSARIAGDVMDLSLLGLALRSGRAEPARAAAATAAVAGVTALDVLCRQQLDKGGRTIRLSVSVNRSPEELYRFWRNPQNFPRVMKNVESVQVGDRRWHWAVKGPGGKRIEWDADIIGDQPNELIEWRSVKGAQVENAGVVRFEPLPAGRGTAVKVEMQYRVPGGALSAALAKFSGDAPEQQVWEALHSFKQIMETGEVATTRGQPSGRRPPSILEKFEKAVQP